MRLRAAVATCESALTTDVSDVHPSDRPITDVRQLSASSRLLADSYEISLGLRTGATDDHAPFGRRPN